jgi:hypothetical protein
MDTVQLIVFKPMNMACSMYKIYETCIHNFRGEMKLKEPGTKEEDDRILNIKQILGGSLAEVL